MITVYTKNNCVACKMTKKWLENNAINKDFHWIENNVDEDLASLEYLIENDLRTLPVVIKDDEVLAMGFQPHKLKTLLN